jgi:hypothetical protein
MTKKEQLENIENVRDKGYIVYHWRAHLTTKEIEFYAGNGIDLIPIAYDPTDDKACFVLVDYAFIANAKTKRKGR